MTDAAKTPVLKTVKLGQLKFGHEHPFDDYNPRTLGRDDISQEMLADLRKNWILENLIATSCGDEPWLYAFVGNRRLKHAFHLADESPAYLDKDVAVLAYTDLTRAEAMDIAFSEENLKMPLHAADQVVAFRRAILDGQDASVVADRFGTSRAIVLQRLALGSASPRVLDAWRTGEIDQAAVEAFTLAPDHKTQDKVMAQLRKSHCLQAAHIRGRLLPEQGDTIPLLNFVGTGPYEAGGGVVIKDLFHGQHGVSDRALLKKLADDKLVAATDLFMAQGWSWAVPESELPAEWIGWARSGVKAALDKVQEQQIAEAQKAFDTPDAEAHRTARILIADIQMTAELRVYSARQKAKSGVVLRIGGDGNLQITAGVIKPPAATAPAKVIHSDESFGVEPRSSRLSRELPSAVAPEPEARLSSAGVGRLADTLTDASAAVLANEPDLALCVLLAAAHGNTGYGAVRISHAGAGSNGLKMMAGDAFAKNLARLLGMKKEARAKLLAQLTAAALKFQAHSPERPALADDEARAIVSALPPKKLMEALKRRFDPDEYFNRSTPTGLIDVAIRECHGLPRLEAMAGETRDAKNKFMLANLPDDWLPPELRWDGYAGPGAKPKKAKKGVRK